MALCHGFGHTCGLEDGELLNEVVGLGTETFASLCTPLDDILGERPGFFLGDTEVFATQTLLELVHTAGGRSLVIAAAPFVEAKKHDFIKTFRAICDRDPSKMEKLFSKACASRTHCQKQLSSLN